MSVNGLPSVFVAGAVHDKSSTPCLSAAQPLETTNATSAATRATRPICPLEKIKGCCVGSSYLPRPNISLVLRVPRALSCRGVGYLSVSPYWKLSSWEQLATQVLLVTIRVAGVV